MQKLLLCCAIFKKEVRSTHHVTCLFQLFRSLDERTLKLRFCRCPRACLALKNNYFIKYISNTKAGHFQKKIKNVFKRIENSIILVIQCWHFHALIIKKCISCTPLVLPEQQKLPETSVKKMDRWQHFPIIKQFNSIIL